MPRVEETIPEALAAEAEAARAWFSQNQGTEFKLTGIVDPEAVEDGSEAGGRQLQLILCGHQGGQDVCLRERFETRRSGNGFDVVHLGEPGTGLASAAPLLDPPKGVRAQWLSDTLAKHAFTVLVFYRGFW